MAALSYSWGQGPQTPGEGAALALPRYFRPKETNAWSKRMVTRTEATFFPPIPEAQRWLKGVAFRRTGH